MDLEGDARLTLKIHGQVQGVGFRFGILKQVGGLGLTGWVRNAPDGTVEVVAEGARGALEKILEWCRKGPSFARVDETEVAWEEFQGEFEGFEVRY